MLDEMMNQLILEHVKSSWRSSIALKVSEIETDSFLSPKSKYGGNPWLPVEIAWPTDRKGIPMRFVGQINFADMPSSKDPCIRNGLLSIFQSTEYFCYPEKDRTRFSILWLDCPENTNGSYRNAPGTLVTYKEKVLFGQTLLYLHPDQALKELNGLNLSEKERQEIQAYIFKFNQSCIQAHQLWGPDDPQLEEAKLICAFASNGISYNLQRKSDAMFNHLVQAANQWHPLWRIGHDWCGEKKLLVMICNQDLQANRLENAWLLSEK